MFIVPRRGFAVLFTLMVVSLLVLLTGCAQAPVRAAADTRSCPVGMVEVYRASGADRNAATLHCDSPSQVEARFDWLSR